jgi:hypothetical protein
VAGIIIFAFRLYGFSVTLAGIEGPLDQQFINPSNTYKIFHYTHALDTNTVQNFCKYGAGGTLAFLEAFLYDPVKRDPAQIAFRVGYARENGLDVWLGDDFGYPSGMAGGQVVQENSSYQVRGVFMLTEEGASSREVTIQVPSDAERMLCAVLYPVDGGQPDFSKGEICEAGPAGVSVTAPDRPWKLCAFVLKVRDRNTQAQTTMAQFKHTGQYPDLMNPDAMRRFIEIMHACLWEGLGNQAGEIEGFYSNEPNLMQLNWVTNDLYACASWTPGLPAKFKEMHGYDPLPALGALYTGDDLFSRRFRIHYYQTVAELMSSSFSGQIRSWCAKQGVKSAGHLLLEEYLMLHVPNYGDLMKVAAEFDVPAVDIGLPEPDKMMMWNYHFMRMFGSIAASRGSDEVICLLDPIIGGYGRNRVSPAVPVLRNVINMGFLHGVNRFSTYCPLDAYTPGQIKELNDYTGRIAALLRGARIETTVALYYPISEYQSAYKPVSQRWPAIRSQFEPEQKAWDDIQVSLLDAGIGYHLVSPDVLGQAQIRDGVLTAGRIACRVLIMPRLTMISLPLLEKLQQFEAAGGKVIWVDLKPGAGFYAHEDAGVVAALQNITPVSAANLTGEIAVHHEAGFDVTVSSASCRVDMTRFSRGGARLYYLVNRTLSPADVNVSAVQTGAVRVYDPVDGTIKEKQLPAAITIGPLASVLLVQREPNAGRTGDR